MSKPEPQPKLELKPLSPVDQLKQTALEDARTIALQREAKARGYQIRDLKPQDYKATLADYMLAAERLKEYAQKSGIDWSKEIYADMSGLEIKGFVISEEDIKAAGVEHTIAFDNSFFEETVFRPATTLEYAKNAQFNNVTFDGMQQGDTVTMSGQHFHDVRFTNIKGGTIAIADHAAVDGLDISGVEAHINVGKAHINELNANSAHMLSFQATPGAKFTNSKLNGATIDGNSTLVGTIWQNVKMNDVGLDSLDMSGATLENVTIKGSHVFDLNLKGATIKGLTLDGVDPKQIKGLFDPSTKLEKLSINGVDIKGPEDLQEATKKYAISKALGTGAAESLKLMVNKGCELKETGPQGKPNDGVPTFQAAFQDPHKERGWVRSLS